MFVYKTDKYSRLTKYKARLIVRRDQQHKYDLSTKATTLATTSFRIFLTLIAKFDLKTFQIDAVNTFVHINLDELIYIKNPPNFPAPKTVLKLNKAFIASKNH